MDKSKKDTTQKLVITYQLPEWLPKDIKDEIDHLPHSTLKENLLKFMQELHKTPADPFTKIVKRIGLTSAAVAMWRQRYQWFAQFETNHCIALLENTLEAQTNELNELAEDEYIEMKDKVKIKIHLHTTTQRRLKEYQDRQNALEIARIQSAAVKEGLSNFQPMVAPATTQLVLPPKGGSELTNNLND